MGGAMSRNKGHTFERDIANDLTADMGVKVKRNLDQTREGKNDLNLPPFRIECKRYRAIGVMKWMKQAIAACELSDTPVVIARADKEDPIVIMLYSDWKRLAREEIALHQ